MKQSYMQTFAAAVFALAVFVPHASHAITQERIDRANGFLAEAFSQKAGSYSQAYVEMARAGLMLNGAVKGKDADWAITKYAPEKIRNLEIGNYLAVAKKDLEYARTASSDVAAFAFLRLSRRELKQALDLQEKPFTWTAIGENDAAMEAYRNRLLNALGTDGPSAKP